MKNACFSFFLAFLILACDSDKYQTQKYLSDIQRDSLLVNIITFVSLPVNDSNNKTKFDVKYRESYAKTINQFELINYYPAPNGWNYYFLTRPVGNSSKFKRGVLGKFKLNNKSLFPTQFEEIANTPHLEQETLKIRGEYLFKAMVLKGNLDEQMQMKQYIEWPDKHLNYDKTINEWISKKPY